MEYSFSADPSSNQKTACKRPAVRQQCGPQRRDDLPERGAKHARSTQESTSMVMVGGNIFRRMPDVTSLEHRLDWLPGPPN